jgi:predicted transcriptional regulator
VANITLEDARTLLNLSQVEVDRRAGLAKGTTHDIEAGRVAKPSHDTVTRIVRVLRQAGMAGVTGEQLFPVDEAKAS